MIHYLCVRLSALVYQEVYIRTVSLCAGKCSCFTDTDPMDELPRYVIVSFTLAQSKFYLDTSITSDPILILKTNIARIMKFYERSAHTRSAIARFNFLSFNDDDATVGCNTLFTIKFLGIFCDRRKKALSTAVTFY